MNRLRALKRWLWHRFGWNTGTVVSWYTESDLMVGFKCSCCDEVRHAGPVPGTHRRTVFPWGSFPDDDQRFVSIAGQLYPYSRRKK